MPTPDSSAIDTALVTYLQADAALLALLPDGVYVDEGPENVQRFALVSLVDAFDTATFVKGRAIEDITYLVQAIVLSSSGGNIRAAAARIDTLLEGGTLLVPGYTFMAMHRTERVRATEVDAIDKSIRWQHRGGRYRVQVSPL